MLRFPTIHTTENRETVFRFRRDSFKVSFGSDEGFGKEADYIAWLEAKIPTFPNGFVLVEENGKYIGQCELSIREYDGRQIGYVHLYYLIPEMRGIGKGKALHQYACAFFKENKVNEYHLRVAPGNEQAYHFYLKNGMEVIGPELDGKVIRMRGKL